MYKDTIGYVDSIMANNPECKFIILADFNCNIYDMSHPYTSQWAFLGEPFSKPPEASNLIFFAQLNPVCVINALASKNIQLYGPQGPQRPQK